MRFGLFHGLEVVVRLADLCWAFLKGPSLCFDLFARSPPSARLPQQHDPFVFLKYILFIFFERTAKDSACFIDVAEKI
jgi:hypothetical protein